jgi:formylmethanofuran dehydrogenase subunit E
MSWETIAKYNEIKKEEIRIDESIDTRGEIDRHRIRCAKCQNSPDYKLPDNKYVCEKCYMKAVDEYNRRRDEARKK